MTEPLLLGIDVGTTAAKAVLFTGDGRQQALGQAEYPLVHTRPGWVEQHPQDWWRAVCSATRQALAGVTDGAARVAGIAVSAQAPSVVILDRKGEPLRPALIWMDRRAEAEAVRIGEHLGANQVLRVTGNRPDPFYIAAKLLWLKTHEPHLLAQTHKIVLASGYINYRLTGAYSLDPVHAALLQLQHYPDGIWWEPLCELCGVVPEQFATVAPGQHRLGEITPTAAEETGLLAGTTVMVGTVDGTAAALEAGLAGVGTAAEMTGTSTVLLMPADHAASEPAFIAMPHAVDGVYLLLGATVASGASLRWFRDQFGQLEIQAGASMNLDPFDLLTQQAGRVDACSDGVVFLPYMMGERSPIWHTQARGVFFGLSLATSRAAMIRAVLEGTAFALRHNAEIALSAGVHFDEIRSVGGGARSALWNQIKADVLGMPVVLPAVSAGAPFGGAVLAAVGLGWYPSVREALEQTVRLQTRYEPDAERHERYTRQYGLYRKLYEHLRDDFDELAALTSQGQHIGAQGSASR